MKKYKLIPLFLAAALSLSAIGCSDSKDNSSSSSVGTVNKLDDIANNEIKAGLNEEASANETAFKLNGVIDSGMTDEDGGKYIFLDVSIKNSTDITYELNTLNNFYILLPDGTESHFDIRTQLYAVKNLGDYTPSPFEISANGEFNGIIGGYIIDKSFENFTVCFFPTLDNARDKSNVIKVDVNSSDIVKLEAPQAR